MTSSPALPLEGKGAALPARQVRGGLGNLLLRPYKYTRGAIPSNLGACLPRRLGGHPFLKHQRFETGDLLSERSK